MSLETRLFRVQEAVKDVAVGTRPWADALSALTDATGSRSGELISFGETPLQVITDVDEDLLGQFRMARGHDPDVNSRVRVGLRAPEMTILDESHFDTLGDRKRHGEYGRILDQIDIPYAQLAVLERTTENILGVTLLGSARGGIMGRTERKVMTAALPHILSAVRVQRACEGRAIALATAAFEQSGTAAFLLDRGLRLKAMTAPASVLLQRGDFRLKDQRLGLPAAADGPFQLALRRAALFSGIGDPAPVTARASGPDGLAYIVEAAPLPAAHGFSFDAAVVVIARAPRCLEARAAKVAALLYGLTPAESSVAGLLATGLSAHTIAERKGVTIGYVRTHIRRLLDKTGSRNQIDLIAALVARL